MNKKLELPDARFLLTAVTTWLAASLLCVLLCVLLCALVVQLSDAAAGTVGYISSALSFGTAVAAGGRAAHVRGRGAVYTGLASGVVIITLALTLGFIIAGQEISADGVLSVVTFTLSGALVGSVFFAGRGQNEKKARFLKR